MAPPVVRASVPPLTDVLPVKLLACESVAVPPATASAAVPLRPLAALSLSVPAPLTVSVFW